MKKYTPEQHEWLRSFIPGHKADEIVEAFNKRFNSPLMTKNKIKGYKKNHNIPSGTTRGRTKGEWTGPLWTKDMVDFVIANNKGKTQKELAELVSKNFHKEINDKQIKAIRGRLKLDSGLTGRFEKGHVPPNKGRKGYHTPGSEKGWFKKGQTPWNHVNVGDEAWTSDGYLKVKIAEPNRWKQKHVLVWEQHNGKVPAGFMITFKDQNHANCSIENLTLITKSENAIMNNQGLRSEDPELTETGILLARLKSKVSKKEKQKEIE